MDKNKEKSVHVESNSCDTKALQHMLAWGIQHIYQTQKDAQEITADKEMSEEKRIELLRGTHGLDYKLLNLILLLQPAIEQAKREYPEQSQFFEWFAERWQYIQEQKYVKRGCECKGCKDGISDAKAEAKTEDKQPV